MTHKSETNLIMRAILAFFGLVGGWLCGVAYLLMLKAMFERGLEIATTALWSGFASVFTLLWFAGPVAAVFPARWQLRYGWLLVVLSLVWSLFMYRGFLQTWPWSHWRQEWRTAYFFPLWFVIDTIGSVGCYLFLLKREENSAR